jgi:hypothetical protein
LGNAEKVIYRKEIDVKEKMEERKMSQENKLSLTPQPPVRKRNTIILPSFIIS